MDGNDITIPPIRAMKKVQKNNIATICNTFIQFGSLLLLEILPRKRSKITFRFAFGLGDIRWYLQ